jgi:hypothetical protein
MLDKEEREWLNSFNETVFREISPFLSKADAGWLKKKTRPI